MEKDFNFWADIGPPGVDLDAESHNGQNTGHAEKILTNVEGDVGRGEGDGDLHKSIVEHSGQPEDRNFGHDVTKEGTTQCYSDEIDEYVQSCKRKEKAKIKEDSD